jgi:hypothetical protein
MPDYSALVAFWDTLTPAASGNISQMTENLAIINAKTVIGRVVPASDVGSYLELNGDLLTLEAFATSPPSGDTNATAILAARLLVRVASGESLTKQFDMSDPTTSARLQGMLAALVSDPNSGVVAADQTAILAMASIPWQSAPVSLGGAGLPGSVVNAWDLHNAGLISDVDANAVELAAQ